MSNIYIRKSYIEYSLDRLGTKIENALGPNTSQSVFEKCIESVTEHEKKLQENHHYFMPAYVTTPFVFMIPAAAELVPFNVGACIAAVGTGLTCITMRDLQIRDSASRILCNYIDSNKEVTKKKESWETIRQSIKDELNKTWVWKHVFFNKAYQEGDLGLFGC